VSGARSEPGTVTRPARGPRLSEHTDAILREVLGHGERTIGGRRAKGAIG
jgi:hypothetical protein